jgi:C-terminal processing protease CtpA/Prc
MTVARITSILFLGGAFLAPIRALPSGDEDRFDPPLGGASLGIAVRSSGGRLRIGTVERGSAAERASLLVGDEIVRVGDRSGFRTMDEFVRAVEGLRSGGPIEVEVVRDGVHRILPIVPDPAILLDLYQLLGYLRESTYLKSREGFPELRAWGEDDGPEALRKAGRASQAYEILNGALGRLGTSHTALIPAWSFQNLFLGDQEGRPAYSTGAILEPLGGSEGRFFICEVLDGSPAAGAGLLRGDEVLAVNGLPARVSPRRILAGYEARRPHYSLQVERGETVRLEVRREPGGSPVIVEIPIAGPIDGGIASGASVRSLERGDRRLVYVHLYNLLSPNVPGTLARALGDRGAEGIIADFRGRGGRVDVMSRVVARLKADPRPLVILIDRDTRSAKEIAAWQLKGSPRIVLVGEPTAGAVLPGAIRELPDGARVMLPADPRSIDRMTGGSLEGRGVAPDVPVERPGPYSAGADPILEAGIAVALERLAAKPRKRRI